MISVQYTREHASTYALIAGVTRVLCAVWRGSDAVAEGVRWVGAGAVRRAIHTSISIMLHHIHRYMCESVRESHAHELFPPPLPPHPFSESE